MSSQKHYSPQLNRFLVCVLWHEGQRQRKPMTAVANTVLENALRASESWKEAEAAMALNEKAPPYATEGKDHAT